MEYTLKAISTSGSNGEIQLNHHLIPFGITVENDEENPIPVDFFNASLGACVLKNVERLSSIMNFDYTKAEIELTANRINKPTNISSIRYKLKVYSSDTINLNLLKKNIENHGTIYNTVKQVCKISGNIELINSTIL